MPPWRWAKRRNATLLQSSELDRLSRSVAFIAALMDSKGFNLAIADMPGANRLTRHVLAAAVEHERHMIGAGGQGMACALQSARHKARQSRAGPDQPGKVAEQAQALRPHIEGCIEAGRTSSNSIAADLNARKIAAPNGGEWFPMQVRRVRDRLGL